METETVIIEKPKIAITGIKVKEGGMKGLEVSYFHQEEKDGKKWNIEDWQDRKIPIGEKLDNVIKGFRYYLLDIYGYNPEDVNVADCKIKEIKFSGDIVIIGELRVLNGSRTVTLKTCKVDNTLEYDKMAELNGLVKQLKEEVDGYMEGKSIMSEKQLVMQFYSGKKGFDEAEFAGLNEEQMKEKYTAALEKMGSIVIHNEEIGTESPNQGVVNSMIAASNEEGGEKTESGDTKKTLDFKSEEKPDAKVITPNFGALPVVETKVEKTVEELNPIIDGEEGFAVTPVAIAK